ncbi:hypothetical protein EVAR_58880_1 [Eumeta japonica]|uniref:Uncharacterized protein n=1 Tax=Eumeta variegata TaxID=151549 RepID=A0A4C1ZDG4_EUMVA|nr:hypothetical protein EVAR_58880_1 [Eumeta japonica]
MDLAVTKPVTITPSFAIRRKPHLAGRRGAEARRAPLGLLSRPLRRTRGQRNHNAAAIRVSLFTSSNETTLPAMARAASTVAQLRIQNANAT